MCIRDRGYTVADRLGRDGVDPLTNVERLQFADSKLALDIKGNAGTTAKILGAGFGSASLTNKVYVGIGLELLDAGTRYTDLMSVALSAKLGAGFSNADEVSLLWTNLFGIPPTIAEAAPFVAMLDLSLIHI